MIDQFNIFAPIVFAFYQKKHAEHPFDLYDPFWLIG